MRIEKIGIGLFLLFVLSAQAATANEIVVEGDGNPSYLTFIGDAPGGISAFGVEIRYSSDTQITAVESVEPFEIVSSVNATNKTIRIGGYVTQDSGTTGSDRIQLAKIRSTQPIEGVILVDYLEDFERKSIPVSNQVIVYTTQTETPVAPYEPQGTYSPPGSGENPTNPTEIGTPTTTKQPSSGSQVPVSGAPTTTLTSPSETGNQPSPTGTAQNVPETQTEATGTVMPVEQPPTAPPTSAPLSLFVPVGALLVTTFLVIKGRGDVRRIRKK
jgi:hypothetical protein